jgi:dTDP-glucose 4,6-dehydratase
MENALSGRPVRVVATHEVIRSYMYADDLAEWLMATCACASHSCPVFNVGSDEAVTIRELAAIVAELGNVAVVAPPLDIDLPIDRYVPDVSLAHRALGLTVKIPLRQALTRTFMLLSKTQYSSNGVAMMRPM